jgi:hypothetical protein
MVNINPILQKIGTSLDEYVKKAAKETTVSGEKRKTSLTYFPDHENGEEFVKIGEEMGLDIAAFPKLTLSNCERHDEAKAVIDRGLSHSLALCPTCPHQHYCEYRCKLTQAFKAQHAVATHQRGVYAREEVTANRTRIEIHEDPLTMLRPSCVIKDGLLRVALVAERARMQADDGTDARFFRRMGKIARWLHHKLRRAKKPEAIGLPNPPKHVPDNLHDILNTCIIKLGIDQEKTPPAKTMKLVLAAALGELTDIFVSVEDRPNGRKADGTMRTKRVKKLVGVANMKLSPDVELWINDATTTKDELEAALGQPVEDVTPKGRLLLQHPVIQVIPYKDREKNDDKEKSKNNDITKGTKPEQVVPILRGLMYDLPHRRIGLLTHQHLAKTLPALIGSSYQERLTMVAWFGGGQSRGSNKWMKECDVLLILGTPRVSATDIRMHLIVLGKIAAAKMEVKEAGWGMDYWLALTESGKRRVVKTPHYSDHDWHAAYCSKTRSELIQAIGRGRGYLEEGIPVILVSTENLAPPDDDDGRNGFPVADEGRFAPLTDGQVKVLGCLNADKGTPTAAIALKVGLSPLRVSQLLIELEAAGRVQRAGSVSKGRGRPILLWQLAQRGDLL